jgi:hypothetical protein
MQMPPIGLLSGLHGLISSDAGNNIKLGTDGKLFSSGGGGGSAPVYTPGLPAIGDALVTATGKTLKILQKVSSTGILMNAWEIAPA